MTYAEILEHIRVLLQEPLDGFGIPAQSYDDDFLYIQVRSALRHLEAIGVIYEGLLTVTDGIPDFDIDPTTRQGVLISLRVVSSLLRSDITQRVVSGSLGMVFRMGNDLIDTKTAAIQLGNSSSGYMSEYNILLVLELSGENEVFGGPYAPGA